MVDVGMQQLSANPYHATDVVGVAVGLVLDVFRLEREEVLAKESSGPDGLCGHFAVCVHFLRW